MAKASVESKFVLGKKETKAPKPKSLTPKKGKADKGKYSKGMAC